MKHCWMSRWEAAGYSSWLDWVQADPELAAHTSLSYRVRRVLSRGALTTEQIAEALEVSEATVRSTLRRMPDVQRVSVGGGRGNSTTWGLVTEDDDERF